MSGSGRSTAVARGRGSRGFTLIEMIVAILLIGVGLMGLAALSTTVTRANVQSSALTTASALAQEKIEGFRAVPYESITSSASAEPRTLDGVTFSRTWTVANDTPAANLKTIVVTVAWTSRGKTHSTTLSTIRGAR